MTTWIDPRPVTVPAAFENLGLPALIVRTLVHRGLGELDTARAFLDPSHYTPTPSTEIPGLAEAAERIDRAIRRGESICVWGDFDVDGQTATAILVESLTALGANVTYHIPVRARESHGVNVTVLKEIIDNGAQLILTCDTGISAHETVDYACSRGVDMVITDHHELPPELPRAAAATNPRMLPDNHPLHTLAGAGLAYKLAEELLISHEASRSAEMLLDLAALGLVADVATLTGETRYLVQKGLETLRQAGRLGLKTMMEIAELNPANLTEEHIGFVLGPRLNAIGRLGDANPAVELLTTQNPARARVLAYQLEGLNAQRQLLTRQVTEAAEAQLRADPGLLSEPIIVLAHPAWPSGVIGIAASRLVERYNRPAILLASPPGEPARGSARSIEGVNITAAIAAQENLLLKFGGHPMAAGLSLDAENLADFRRGLARTVRQMGVDTRREISLQIDAWLELPDLNLELAEALESLAPYGAGNEKLTLATRKLSLISTASIGRGGEHLKLRVEDANHAIQEVLWWNGAGEELPEAPFDLAYTLRASNFRGARQATVEFVGFRAVETEKIEVIRRKKREIIDQRDLAQPLAQLPSLNLPPETLLWAEGTHKKDVSGISRYELSPAPTLAIWTVPPGMTELCQAINIVKPETIYLFGNASAEMTPEAFLARLAGLVKYVINQRGGRTTLSMLASAMAAREAAIRAGVEWLKSGGQVEVWEEPPGEFSITAAGSESDEGSRARWMSILAFILDETNAYRQYYLQADKDSLIP